MCRRYEVHSISPDVAGRDLNLLKVACPENNATMVFVVVVVLVDGQVKKRKILRPKPLAQFVVGREIKQRLSSPFNLQVGIVIRIQSIAFVIEDVALDQRWSPVQYPPLLGAKTIVD